MRRTLLGLAVVLGLAAAGVPARAQDVINNGGFSDPFFLYYSYYLPRQAALANRPGPQLTINQNAAARRDTVMADRSGLYERTDLFGDADLDPLRPFGTRSGSSRVPVPRSPNGVTHQNLQGRGLPGYHNRTNSYYPSLRSGGAGAVARGPSSTPAVRPRASRLRGGSSSSGALNYARTTLPGANTGFRSGR